MHSVGLGIRFCTALGLWGFYWRPLSCLMPHCSLSHLSDKRGSRSFVVSLVSLLMATLCLYSTEGLILHSPPWGSAPLYGNPCVNRSSNHAWVCHSFWHCTGTSSLPLEYMRDLMDLVTTAALALSTLLGTEQACNQHWLNEWVGSFCIFCLNLEGIPQARFHPLHLHYLLLATGKLTILLWDQI